MTSPSPTNAAAGAPSSANSARRTIGRAEIVDLARSGKHWAFLAVASQALDQSPDDGEIRFLTAATLGALGLGTLATGQLNRLDEKAQGDPSVTELFAALRRLPDDRVASATLEQNVKANLAALAGRGVKIDAESVAAWESKLLSRSVHRALDGNMIRRDAEGEGRDRVRAWTGLSDLKASSVSAVDPAKLSRGLEARPVVVEGIDPPWLLERVAAVLEPAPEGYRPAIFVVQEDAQEFLDGLSLADLRTLLADGRIEFFVGAGAAEKLARRLAAARETSGPQGLFTVSCRTRAASLDLVIRGAIGAQERESRELGEKIRARSASRGAAYWRARYRDAMSEGGEPLRVLIPTSRFTTFLSHAAGDLSRAITRAGHRARILMEPSDRERLNALAYQRQVLEFDPDLIVMINRPRACMKNLFPSDVPYVTWLQDAMPQLFDEVVGRAQGPMDFMVGHMLPELFRVFGYPCERLTPMPVVADAEKFHDGEVDPRDAERFACEVAVVTHHSETPEAMHGRLRGQLASAPAIQVVLDHLFPQLERVALDPMSLPPNKRIGAMVDLALRQALDREPEAKTRAMVMRNYALPVADRFFRHQAIRWAADACERRGWRLHLYGNGWETHGAFSRFAKGGLAHGEELRAAYKSAAVNLHLCLTSLVHQRVLECFLSGGFVAARLHRDLLSGVKTRAQLAAMASGATPIVDDAHDRIGYPVADIPEAMEATALLQRLGMAGEETLWIANARAAALKKYGAAHDRFDENWLLGDLSAIGFSDGASLEALIERALERTAWRQDIVRGVGSRVRGRLTHDALFNAAIGAITTQLESMDATPAIHRAA
ncbi:MAG: hypothetical protein IT434_02075 [Phycisphaerales bacterium]|nr:hypothetical protein [Phycisphaerales bacterium]